MREHLVRILVADDYKDMRRVVRLLLELQPGLTVCGEAEDGIDAVNKTAALKPDLVVLDLRMPNLDGLQAGRAILGMSPDMPVLLFSLLEIDEATLRQSGFRGSVPRHEAMLPPQAINQVISGGTYFVG